MIRQDFQHNLRLTLGTLSVLLVAAVLKQALGDRTPTSTVEHGLEILGRTGLSERDEQEMTAGYYEGLLDKAQQTAGANRGVLGQIGIVKSAPPDWLVLSKTSAVRWRNDFLKFDMKPNVDIPFSGDRLQTDAWGLRDRAYDLVKPKGVRRFALCGSSIGMGSGVPIDRSYEALLESWLNAQRPCPPVSGYEILNFSVPGYKITQQFYAAVEEAARFRPDVTILELNHVHISSSWGLHIAQLVRDGDDLRYDFLREVARRADLKRSDSSQKICSKLTPFLLDVMEGVLRTADQMIRQQGGTLVMLKLPFPRYDASLKPRLDNMLARVADLHLPVIDVMDAFNGRTMDELTLRPWDHHPNELGHRLMFESIERAVRKDARLWTLLLGCGGRGLGTDGSGRLES